MLWLTRVLRQTYYINLCRSLYVFQAKCRTCTALLTDMGTSPRQMPVIQTKLVKSKAQLWERCLVTMFLSRILLWPCGEIALRNSVFSYWCWIREALWWQNLMQLAISNAYSRISLLHAQFKTIQDGSQW